MPKFKKNKEERTPISNMYDLVETTYTFDPKGEKEIRIGKPVVIKLDKK